ncbi:MAG: hypothetical protein F6K41_33635 [Symploca sp. SIO3E6]|nr:hypothetical protein [Caldora sp. SIO3E6]
MGFFTWLGCWLDRVAESVFSWLVDVTSWVVERLAVFVKILFETLQKVWSTEVVFVLIKSFGIKDFLHVIFYATRIAGETIMEIWDPLSVYSKPSQVFKVQQAKALQMTQSQALRTTPAPQSSPLPKYRTAAKVLKLENWY